MKQKLNNFVHSTYGKISTGLIVASASIPLFADEIPSISTVVQSSLQQVVTDTITTIGAIAPIGITIFGATFVWKKGVQFFKQVAK